MTTGNSVWTLSSKLFWKNRNEVDEVAVSYRKIVYRRFWRNGLSQHLGISLCNSLVYACARQPYGYPWSVRNDFSNTIYTQRVNHYRTSVWQRGLSGENDDPFPVPRAYSSYDTPWKLAKIIRFAARIWHALASVKSSDFASSPGCVLSSLVGNVPFLRY